VNWKDISEELQAAALVAVRDLLSKHQGEHIYALALFTSDDGASVAMVANTEEGYQAHLAAEAENEPNSPEDEIYYRWTSSEWLVEGWCRAVFSPVNALLAQQDVSDFDSYFDNLIEAMITALVATKAAMGERLADVTAFVTVTDSDTAGEIENASASRINAADLAGRFLLRFG
jgi:hypothetical protein